jgi:hypothetical protein
MPLNACELEIDLFCRGMRVPEGVSLAGARPVSRTRAGLGSGLELVIPTRSHVKPEIWVNAPVIERFAQASPYRLENSARDGCVVIDILTPARTPCVCHQNHPGTHDRHRTTS